MNIVLKYINSSKLNRMFKLKKYLLEMDNKYNNCSICGKLADKVDKKINKLYRFKKYHTDKKINYELIRNNPQFQIVNDSEYMIATRNEINKGYKYLKLYKKIESIKNYKVVHSYITNGLFRGIVTFSIMVLNSFNTSHNLYSSVQGATISMINLSLFNMGTIFDSLNRTGKGLYEYEKEFSPITNRMEDIYQTIINSFCLLAYSLNIDNPISLMSLYNIMNDFGCLSVNHKFKNECNESNDDIMDEIVYKPGYNIICGHGVCRHHSVFFRDVCLRMGYDAKVIAGELINRGKHAIVEVRDGDEYYYMDPLNQGCLIFNETRDRLVVYPKIDENIEMTNTNYKYRRIMKKVGFYPFSSRNITNLTSDEFIKKYLLYNPMFSNTNMPNLIDKFYFENRNLYIEFDKLFNEYIEKFNKPLKEKK